MFIFITRKINNPSQVKIVVGENSIPDDGEVGEATYSVLRIILQDDYSPTTMANDIALIEVTAFILMNLFF